MYLHITPVRNTLQWLPIEHCSVFNTALLVYKFIQSGYPKYVEPLLKPRHSVFNVHRIQVDGVVLDVPHFASVCKSSKNFGLNFAYDAPVIWNDLPDNVPSLSGHTASEGWLPGWQVLLPY